MGFEQFGGTGSRSTIFPDRHSFDGKFFIGWIWRSKSPGFQRKENQLEGRPKGVTQKMFGHSLSPFGLYALCEDSKMDAFVNAFFPIRSYRCADSQ